MFGRKDYTRQKIDTARALIEADLRAYRDLPAKARTGKFETLFFNRETQILDYLFVHRLREVEGKDGNPLVEVRVLRNSILLNSILPNGGGTSRSKNCRTGRSQPAAH